MRKFVLLFLTVLATGSLLAQNRQVSGTVTSSDGSPVAGATVTVQGTSTGTITDGSGRYSLSASSDGTINVSFFGMVSQSVAIGNRNVVDVVLQPDAQQVESVVVLGLGITRTQKSTGYATQEIAPELLTQTSNTSLAGALQGKVSGVSITPSSGMPGASSMMVIRGARSFTGNNAPLYVVDGMPITSGTDISSGGTSAAGGTDFANRGVDIDPNDIESIQILKGQAASALYGMRASNGVVMITTKSGRGGEKGRTNVSFNTSVTFDEISRYPQYQTTYAQGQGGVFQPTASFSWGPEISELAKDPVYGYGGTGTGDAYWNKWAGSASQGEYYVPQRAWAGLDPWVTPRAYANNVKDFFKTGVTNNNSINISKATDQNVFSLTLSNAYNKGIIPSTGMERYNAKFSAETKLNRAWTIGFSGNYVNTSITKGSGANDGLVATLYAIPPSYDHTGIPSHYENEPWRQVSYRAVSFDNAYWYTKNNKNEENTSRFFGNGYVTFKPELGSEDHNLNFRLQLGTDAYATKYTNLWGYGHGGMDGEITERLFDRTSFNGVFMTNYDWTINDKLRLDASLGSEFNQDNTKTTRTDGLHFNFPEWNHMDNATDYYGFTTSKKYRSVGFLGTATLGYDDQLFLTLTGRNDIVSSMPSKSRSFFYPAVSLGWVFTELEALNNRVLSYGKLRFAFSQVGQEGTYYEPYYEVPVYGGGFYMYNVPFYWPYGGTTAFQPSGRMYDPNLKPQNTNTFETGFDLSFWNGVLGLNYTYSLQNVKGQIFAVPYASSTGVSEVVKNAGHITTNTHEVTLTINPRLGKNFSWVTAINFTKMNNMVKELAPGVESVYLGGFVTPFINASKGNTFPTIYGVSYLKDEATGKMMLDSNGLPMAGPSKVIGSVQPKFMLGANTTFSWKNLSLSAVVDWKHGGEMMAATAGILNYYGVTQDSADARKNGIRYSGIDYLTGETVDVEFTSMSDIQNYYASIDGIDESGVFDSSFVKLRELSLGYDFKIGKDLKMGVNVYARNLLLWTAIPNIDPESSQGNDNMAGALERFSLPQTSSYGLGLSFKF